MCVKILKIKTQLTFINTHLKVKINVNATSLGIPKPSNVKSGMRVVVKTKNTYDINFFSQFVNRIKKC